MICHKTIKLGEYYYKEQGRFLEWTSKTLMEICEECYSKGLHPPQEKKTERRDNEAIRSLDEFGDKR